MFEKTIKKTTAFSGKLLSLEQHDVVLENGKTAYREIVRHPGSVGVIARLPGNQFVFVRQYRKAVEGIMTEVVAGMLDDGEAAEAAALRELEEETGYRTSSMKHLGTIFASPGYVDEKVEIFLADVIAGTEKLNLDHDERIEVIIMTRAKFVAAITSGEIHDSKTLAAWALLREYEDNAIKDDVTL